MANFISRFPRVELPVTLSEDTEEEFYTRHDPLPMPLVVKYLDVFFPPEKIDEFTEFVPCFKLQGTKKFHAMVLWVAGLRTKQFFLITYSTKGKPLHCKAIAGYSFSGKTITRMVARLEEDWKIYLVAGQIEDSEEDPSGKETISTVLELNEEGSIILKED